MREKIARLLCRMGFHKWGPSHSDTHPNGSLEWATREEIVNEKIAIGFADIPHHNMKYYIWFWHNDFTESERPSKYEALLTEKIKKLCKFVDDQYVYEGSLDKFAKEYGHKFIVFPGEERNLLAITQYSTFGQR